MDRMLITCAQIGDIESLLKLIEDDPLLLYKVSLSGQDTPLHIASMAGHLIFVQQVLKLRKEFAYEINQEGFSPLHIASANGYTEIVKQLLTIDQDLCLVKGRERRVALHYAAIKGRTSVMQELLVTSPNSVEEVTARGENALYLAVKNNQFDVLVILVNHLKEFNKECVLNKQDEQGNTVLHLAVSRKQYELLHLLLGRNSVCKESIEVNLVNKNGLTPMDTLFLLQSEAGDMEIEDILRHAGATRTSGNNNTTTVISTNDRSISPSKNLIRYFTYNGARDSPSEVRNCLLVIASLITIATYQAALQPPGGVWQDDSISGSRTSNHAAGKSVMGDKNVVAYCMFLVFNSIGFFASLHMLFTLTSGFPLQPELQIAMFALVITYDTSMTAISPKGKVTTFFTILSIAIPFLLPIVMMMVRNCSKRTRNDSGRPLV